MTTFICQSAQLKIDFILSLHMFKKAWAKKAKITTVIDVTVGFKTTFISEFISTCCSMTLYKKQLFKQ